MRPRPAVPRTLLLSLVLALALAAPAPAAFFPADPVDGPSGDIQSLGEVDVARDGSGALVYVKRDGGVDHVFASLLRGGAWTAPERVDGSLSGASSQPVVTTSSGGRAAIAFVNGGSLYSVVRTAGASSWGEPQLVFGNPGVAPGVTNPSIDMSINGVAYLVFAAPGARSDVGAARLVGTSWTLLPSALDFDRNRAAGDGAMRRPRVAASADNNAVAVWGEEGPDGRDHVYARRLTVLTPSGAPQDVSLADLEGRPGRAADSPEVEIEDDNSYAWVVFRQAFQDGPVARTRAVARRLVGSLFEAPAAVDSLSFPTGEDAGPPRLDMTGRGEGLTGVGLGPSHQVASAILFHDEFRPGQRIEEAGSATASRPVTALGENVDGAIAWQRDGGGNPPWRELRAREFIGEDTSPPTPPKFENEVLLSRPELGTSDAALGLDAGADNAGNAVIVFVQGTGSERRIVSAFLDRPPRRPFGLSTSNWRRQSRPRLTWFTSSDWAPVTYEVRLDGRVLGQSNTNAFQPRTRLRDGVHRWSVRAVDSRGQRVSGRSKLLRIDSRKPRLRVRVRRRGRVARVSTSSSDRSPGSGVSLVRIDFGPGDPVAARSATRRYSRGGRYTIRVSARDRAGNVAVRRVSVRIGR